MATAQPDIIQRVLLGSRYDTAVFKDHEIDALRDRATLKTHHKRDVPFVTCIVRDADIQLTPEEVVRQLYASRLIVEYGYPRNRLAMEYAVNPGTEEKRADIVIRDKDRPERPCIVVEVTGLSPIHGKNQLRSHCDATGASIGVWINGRQISHYARRGPNHFEYITDIPRADQSLASVLKERFTLKDLIIRDRVVNERKSLKDIILDMEDEVLASAGVDVFEEVFKLIVTKLYDESLSKGDGTVIDHLISQETDAAMHEDNQAQAHSSDQSREALKATVSRVDDRGFRVMEFRNTGQTNAQLEVKIKGLFNRATRKWPGMFPEESAFDISGSHLAYCVSSLQDVKLLNSNLLVVEEAFEHLINKSARGAKGQYFTPRHVIDMCVMMLNPQRGETMIDTSAGSFGFPLHTIFKITGRSSAAAGIPEEYSEDVERIFGIDFDEKTVRAARTMSLIAGVDEANVLHLDTLDYDRWKDHTEGDPQWTRAYGEAFERLKRLRSEPTGNKEFNFDLVMANPPFAGKMKEPRILHRYQLGFKGNRVPANVGRDVLFIERNLDFLKPGGRMAIVLPQGRFNNASDNYIREFITERARILAVIGLHQNTFKPHTGTKTSVLFLQKWNDDPAHGALCPRTKDYPVFMAISERSGKDGSGNNVYVMNGNGQPKLDKNGHIVIDHDLHSHDGELPPGIAEAFEEWARAEGLTFFADAQEKDVPVGNPNVPAPVSTRRSPRPRPG